MTAEDRVAEGAAGLGVMTRGHEHVIHAEGPSQKPGAVVVELLREQHVETLEPGMLFDDPSRFADGDSELDVPGNDEEGVDDVQLLLTGRVTARST